MKRTAAALAATVVLVLAAVSSWGQHAGHGGVEMPPEHAVSKEEAAKARVEKMTSLQEKIDVLEEKLDDLKLPEKKKEKIKKKLDALYAKKDEMLGRASDPSAERGQHEMRELAGRRSPDEEDKARRAAAAATPPTNESCAAEGGACHGVAEIFVCPMGDYVGPNTKDGRCPKCGMALRKRTLEH